MISTFIKHRLSFHFTMNSDDVGKPTCYIKRKRKVLTILKKVEIIKKLDLGFTIKYLGQQYGVGNSTIYDIKLRRDEILQYYAESFHSEAMAHRKTLHRGQSRLLDKVLYEWFRNLRSKGVAVSGRMVVDKAKFLHAEMHITDDCDYSPGWLQKFRHRHGIRHLQSSVKSHASEDEESFLENVGDHRKVESLCRLCLVELNNFTYIYEFDDNHRFNVADAISDLLGMDLNPDDGYPTKICISCLEEVAHFRRFKGKCFESKAKLKDMIEEKNCYNDNVILGVGGALFESEGNEVNEIPVPCEEVNPEKQDVNMVETHVKCEILDNEEEEETEDNDMRSNEIDTFLDPHQEKLAGGKSQEDVSCRSQNLGKVNGKKQYLIFCQPVIASDKNNELESEVAVSCSGELSKCGVTKKSDDTLASSSESPIAKTSTSVPVKIEVSSEDEHCGDPQEYCKQGETLLPLAQVSVTFLSEDVLFLSVCADAAFG